ncbi:cobalt-precorrin-6A reductase [Aquipseudomonas ullengensis]|uniref:Cobalt-precorrin-6A reductase n=1 Tax=Aquipseudomonas ullengensis TaxID=2759166 RepID=A0A7W4LNB3_9GAMM|nr:cobalt-precorrin-6A reductase [Pseudomonas ullengensis]MBB2496283.1 cobalt-precorrin-6A reductase [Pseudomonas ullengensis]
MSPRILLLGGVGDALATARQLGPAHIYSLAGLGKVPGDLACQVRVGGFGGAEGLAAFIREQHIGLLLDITHPYAAQISHNAAAAAASCGIPCWALRRPGWQAGEQDDWRSVADWSELSTALATFRRPFFTLGREPLEHLDTIPAEQLWTLRILDAHPGNTRAQVIAARGPFQLEAERALFTEHDFDVLISKNSGGSATEPKLQVARERGLPVLLLARPELPAVDRAFASRDSLWQALHALPGAFG